MIRHDYHATNFSPLNQITAQNVQDLHLVWSWAAPNEGGTNQPAPIVHNKIPVSQQYRQYSASARRPHGGTYLGEPLRHRRYCRGDAGHVHLRRQNIRAPTSAARISWRSTRAPARPSQDTTIGDQVEGQLQHRQRTAGGEGQTHPGPGAGVLTYRDEVAFHQRVRCRHRQKGLEVQHGRAAGRVGRRYSVGRSSQSVPREPKPGSRAANRSGSEHESLLGDPRNRSLECAPVAGRATVRRCSRIPPSL